MKTETEIARENLFENYLDLNKSEYISDMSIEYRNICKIHKESCERFLEFFRNWKYDGQSKSRLTLIILKKSDLRQAIKLYKENGI